MVVGLKTACAILFRSFGFIVQNTILFGFFLDLKVPDKGYSRNAS
jgi:hypothetical protein